MKKILTTLALSFVFLIGFAPTAFAGCTHNGYRWVCGSHISNNKIQVNYGNYGYYGGGYDNTPNYYNDTCGWGGCNSSSYGYGNYSNYYNNNSGYYNNNSGCGYYGCNNYTNYYGYNGYGNYGTNIQVNGSYYGGYGTYCYSWGCY